MTFVCVPDENGDEPMPARSVDDVLNSAPRGYPRPIHPSGLPTPYIANQDDLSDADAFRRAVCVADRLCQVCGLKLGLLTTVCWRPGDRFVIDGAGVHPAVCWPLALRNCPELAKWHAAGTLQVETVATSALVADRTDPILVSGGLPLAYFVPEGAS